MNDISSYLQLLQNSLNIGGFTVNRDAETDFSQVSLIDPSVLFRRSYAMELLKKNWDKAKLPCLLSTDLGIYWLVCQTAQYHEAVVLGPFLSNEVSDDSIDQVLDGYHVPLGLKKKIFDYLRSLPLIRINEIHPYGIMLYYLLEGRQIQREEIEFLYADYLHDVPSSESQMSRKRVYQAERMMLGFIENGDLNYRNALGKSRLLSYGVRMNTGTPLRRNKTNIIIFTTLACRAAMQGGLSPEVAYSKGDDYINRAEKAETTSELSGLAEEMFREFVTLVHEARLQKDTPLVRECLSYLELHKKEKKILQNLARELGYSEYYLSRRFKNEAGMTISEAFLTIRLKEAELLVRTTEIYMEEIAETCGFYSETYFSTCFRKRYGVSPLEYRKRNIR